MKKIFLSMTLALILSAHGRAQVLTISSGSIKKIFTRNQLLKSKNLKTLIVPLDPTYNKEMTYQAVPLTDLLEGLPHRDDSTLNFKCLDGFSAALDIKKVLAKESNASHAFIAIEDPHKAWPRVKNGKVATGPFYLVWESPEKSNVQQEEWPFALAGFEIKASLAEQFPKTLIETQSVHVKNGYSVFMKNCFACHTMNGEGNSRLGPDLNLPHNPTEYLRPEFLRKLIRNNQDVHRWPDAKMSHFDEKALSDSDLADLIKYLEAMAAHRPM
jgi:mono/diheme cytochrome c family protein